MRRANCGRADLWLVVRRSQLEQGPPLPAWYGNLLAPAASVYSHILLMSLSTARIRRFTHPSCVCRQLINISTGIQRKQFFFCSSTDCAHGLHCHDIETAVKCTVLFSPSRLVILTTPKWAKFISVVSTTRIKLKSQGCFIFAWKKSWSCHSVFALTCNILFSSHCRYLWERGRPGDLRILFLKQINRQDHHSPGTIEICVRDLTSIWR